MSKLKLVSFAAAITTGDSTLQKRAGLLATEAELSYQTIVNNLSRQKTQIESKMQKLMDFAPNSTDSLRPNVGGDWDADNWSKEVQALSVEYRMVEIQLEIASSNYNDLFKSEKTEE